MTEALSGCSYNECNFDIEQAVTATGHFPGHTYHNKSKVGVYVFRLQYPSHWEVVQSVQWQLRQSKQECKAVAQSLY